MSLNIKNDRVVALVRELAARTGRSQTAAVEDAVVNRLAELDGASTTDTHQRRAAAREVLGKLHELLTDEDRDMFRRNQSDLYDDAGLPR